MIIGGEEIKPNDWINARDMFKPKPPREPAIDETISRIVGKKIYAQDPRLLKLIIKWKAGKPVDSMEADNFLQDARKVAELKEVLNQPI